ncbi:MAG: 6-carboxytetrahydropterin synthase QueD [Methanotrichaceae archaeon]|nr:6-carboxytetrahydropterin synthase QueD [Methanotrichaceae archaeon]
MKLGLIAEFDAAHHLPGYQGKCSKVHGHTYRVEITIEGQVRQNGFVMDFYELKKMIDLTLRDLDHGDLNEIIPNPTAELIAELIFSRLKQMLESTSIKLICLKLWEGRNKWVMMD